MSSSTSLAILGAVALVCLASAAVPADQVAALPGWSKALPSDQYSGFLSVPKGKHLHYWLVESEGNPKTDPVVFWFNGGPGCSSLDGYMYEHGPFHVTEPIVNTTDGVPELYLNPYRWNKIANLVFLEAPAGVGFSYADTPAGLNHSDTSTAHDNYQAVVDFLTKYPEFKTNEFFVSGESYAGAYVPMLAEQILAHNEMLAQGESTDVAAVKVNLQGILVGNGVTGQGAIPADIGARLRVDFYYGHGLFSAVLYEQIQKACGDYVNPTAQCQTLQAKMHDVIGNVNVYDLYQPCIMDMDKSGAEMILSDAAEIRRNTMDTLRAPLSSDLQAAYTKTAAGYGGPDGCIDAGAASAWLNTAAVKKAIHVTAANKDWQICGGIQYHQNSGSLLPLYKHTLIPAIRVLIFNGDVDACVPYNGNEWWTSSLGLQVEAEWRPWSVDKQVAGYVTTYEQDFHFLTVKGSGHMVPQYRPKQAYFMFERMINNQPF